MNNLYMSIALKEAKKAYNIGDIPVGAVIVKNDKIIAKAYNKKNKMKDPTCHAEILAIKKACRKVGDFRLEGASIYITLEPCVMCYGAILSARIDNIYFGASDNKFSINELKNHVQFNHQAKIEGGVMGKQCSELLSDFFKKLRSEKSANRNTEN